MNGNFVQVSGSGQGGRQQTLAPGTTTQTFFFTPQSLPGKIGNDYIYADRVRLRVRGFITSTVIGAVQPTDEVLAKALGAVRVYSPILGELVPKSLTTAPILNNHDAWFANAFKPRMPALARQTAISTTTQIPIEIEVEIPFCTDYLERPEDTAPWISMLEQGEIALDLRPSTSLSAYGWLMTGTWTATCVLDYLHDSKALIHVPNQFRTYRVNTPGPEYIMLNVGAPQGLDGIVSGSRLGVLSWLATGYGPTVDGALQDEDNGYYDVLAPSGGLNFSINAINRIDIPWRDQRSIDEVTAFCAAFYADVMRVRRLGQIDGGIGAGGVQYDNADFPFNQDDALAATSLGGDPILSPNLNFFPLIWPYGRGSKISDMMQVDGSLSLTASFGNPDDLSIVNLFRTHEFCQFTQVKTREIMARMGLGHKLDGGDYDVVPAYHDQKRSSERTAAYLPMQIVKL